MSGCRANWPAAVTIRRDGRPLGTADLATGEDAVIEFMLEHAGPTVFEIEAAARDGGLPMTVRAFYIHAAQLVGRT